MKYNKYLHASKDSESWSFSIFLSILMLISFCLPWFKTEGSVSYGSQSFSSYLDAAPIDQIDWFYTWIFYSLMCFIFSINRWWFAIIPALLNVRLGLGYAGLMGDGFSASYSAYGGSFSGSSGLSYGFYIFLGSAILFSIATITEVLKFSKNTLLNKNSEQDSFDESDSLKGKEKVDSRTTPITKMGTSRQLEELHRLKDLLESGTITQEEFTKLKTDILNNGVGNSQHSHVTEKAVVKTNYQKEEISELDKEKARIREENDKRMLKKWGLVLLIIIIITPLVIFILDKSNLSQDQADGDNQNIEFLNRNNELIDGSNLPQETGLYKWSSKDGFINEGGERFYNGDERNESEDYIKVVVDGNYLRFYTGSKESQLSEVDIEVDGTFIVLDMTTISYDRETDVIESRIGGATSAYYQYFKRVR